MELDVRNGDTPKIDRIRVASVNRNYNSVEIIEQHTSTHRVKLFDTDNGISLCIGGKEHAQNVIKGLQKAIEMGWLG